MALLHRQVGNRQLIHILQQESFGFVVADMDVGVVHLLHQALALTLHSLIEDTACLAGIAKILVTTQIQLFKQTMHGSLRLFVEFKLLIRSHIQEYLRQFVRRIVVEMDGLCKAALESGVRVDEVMHLFGISRHDTDKLTAVVLQTLQQRVDSLRTKRVHIAGL